MWLLRDLPEGRKCLIKWENNKDVKKIVPVSAVDCFYNVKYETNEESKELQEIKEFILLIGDENGTVKP